MSSGIDPDTHEPPSDVTLFELGAALAVLPIALFVGFMVLVFELKRKR